MLILLVVRRDLLLRSLFRRTLRQYLPYGGLEGEVNGRCWRMQPSRRLYVVLTHKGDISGGVIEGASRVSGKDTVIDV